MADLGATQLRKQHLGLHAVAIHRRQARFGLAVAGVLRGLGVDEVAQLQIGLPAAQMLGSVGFGLAARLVPHRLQIAPQARLDPVPGQHHVRIR